MWKDIWDPRWPLSRQATNGIVINQVKISNSMQIILTKFAVTVVRLPLTYFTFKHFNKVFNFYVSYPKLSIQNSLRSLKQILLCWRYFWKNLFVILDYSLMRLMGNIQTNGKYPNWASTKDFIKSLLCWKFIRFDNLDKTDSFPPAFLQRQRKRIH